MTNVNYIRRACVFNIGFHIIICPKYRRPYLLRYESYIKSAIRRASIKFQFIVAEIDIMPDHVHLFIKCTTTSTWTLPKIIGYIKGGSSFDIRKRFPALKKYKAFWSPSYFVESIGNMSESTIRKYIQNQKVNMKSTYKHKSIVKEHISTKSSHKSDTRITPLGDLCPAESKQVKEGKNYQKLSNRHMNFDWTKIGLGLGRHIV